VLLSADPLGRPVIDFADSLTDKGVGWPWDRGEMTRPTQRG